MGVKFEEMRISGSTNPKKAAYALACSLIEGEKKVTLFAIGAGAVAQGIKACAIARGIVATKGFDLVVRPGFKNGEIDGNERTIMQFIVDLL